VAQLARKRQHKAAQAGVDMAAHARSACHLQFRT
jgi:hypothetical protein